MEDWWIALHFAKPGTRTTHPFPEFHVEKREGERKKQKIV